MNEPLLRQIEEKLDSENVRSIGPCLGLRRGRRDCRAAAVCREALRLSTAPANSPPRPIAWEILLLATGQPAADLAE